jgi:hypothetical protein
MALRILLTKTNPSPIFSIIVTATLNSPKKYWLVSSHLAIFNFDFEPSQREINQTRSENNLSIQILQQRRCNHKVTEVEIVNGQIFLICSKCRKIKSKSSL